MKDTPEGYYYDSNYPNEYRKCDISCKTCDSGDSCLICNNDYYLFEDAPYECVLSSLTIDGYYKDDNSKMFKWCYYLCKSCGVLGTISENKCNECIYGYVKDSLIQSNCIIQCDD